MRSAYLLLAAICVLSSCKKHGGTTPGTSTPQTRLIKYEWSVPSTGQKQIFLFDYNTQGYVSKITRIQVFGTPSNPGSDTIITTYDYNAANKIIKQYTIEGLFDSYTANYSYNSDGTLDIVDYQFANTAQANRTKYLWNNGRVYSVVWTNRSSPTDTMSKYNFFYNSTGQLVREDDYDFVNSSSSKPYGTTTYSAYDNSPNFTAAIRGLNNIFVCSWIFPLFQANNPIHSTNGDFIYEYNADGYPTKQTWNNNTVTVYTYEKK